MTGRAQVAKKRIDDALEALRIGLTPYVVGRMRTVFGHEWRSHASPVVGEELDTSALLKTILSNLKEVFRPELRAHFIHLALDARNEISHFTGTMQEHKPLLYLGAIYEILRAIGAISQQEKVFKLYTEQQSDINPEVAPKINISAASVSVSKADSIRRFVNEQHIVPARQKGITDITIRAGDIHRDMRLANAMPAVCSAIGGKIFAQLANVTLAERSGPPNGSNVFFRFTLGARPPSAPQTVVTPGPLPKTTPPAKTNALNLEGALVLISCVKSKLAHPAPARMLYTSLLFTGPRDIVEESGARWFVLSSLYGLVAPDAIIKPYDYTLNDLGVPERRAWANKVLERLLPEAAGFHRIVMFAGARYREFLVGPLEHRGMVIDIPMEHLTQGEQLAWLKQHRPDYTPVTTQSEIIPENQGNKPLAIRNNDFWIKVIGMLQQIWALIEAENVDVVRLYFIDNNSIVLKEILFPSMSAAQSHLRQSGFGRFSESTVKAVVRPPSAPFQRLSEWNKKHEAFSTFIDI